MFRFTIRDVLWLTVVVAMGLAWWISAYRAHVRLVMEQSERADLQRAFDRLDVQRQSLRNEVWRLKHPGESLQSSAPAGPITMPLISVPPSSN